MTTRPSEPLAHRRKISEPLRDRAVSVPRGEPLLPRAPEPRRRDALPVRLALAFADPLPSDYYLG